MLTGEGFHIFYGGIPAGFPGFVHPRSIKYFWQIFGGPSSDPGDIASLGWLSAHSPDFVIPFFHRPGHPQDGSGSSHTTYKVRDGSSGLLPYFRTCRAVVYFIVVRVIKLVEDKIPFVLGHFLRQFATVLDRFVCGCQDDLTSIGFHRVDPFLG